MNVIGLGNAGCNIVKEFEKYPQYTGYKIDIGERGERCYDFPLFKTSEEYEAKAPNLKSFFKDVDGDILFIMAGSGAISCAVLNILQQLNSSQISVVYVQPELSLLNAVQASRERLVRGVLQQYARSGLLKRMFLVSNPILENIIGDIPIMSYFDKLNEILVSTFHMVHIFENLKPVMGKIENPDNVCRISTVGIFDFIKNEEKFFFPLSKARDICYIYGVNEEKLQTDGALFRTIVNQMKNKTTDKTAISYAVFSTQYADDIAYCVAHASLVQI